MLKQELRFTRLPSGARLAWARSGRGPVLVRVAHWMTHVEHDATSPIWRPWLEQLGRKLSIVRYDERGCGLSSADDTPPSLDAAVEELGAVVDACEAPQVALLGMSAGACAAIAYAALHPDRVSRLVLVGGYLSGLLHHPHAAEALAFHESLARLVEIGWGRANPAVQQFFTTTMVPDASPEQAAALNEQQRQSCDGARAAAILRARLSIDVRALAPRVRCPALVLHAQGDAMVPIERGRELAAALPDARFESLPTRNHIPLPGGPAFERFCEAVTAFLDGPRDGPALTPRERTLASLVAQGRDNRQIAAQLGIAEKTVRNALSALYAKLGVEGRPQAVARTRDLGLG